MKTFKQYITEKYFETMVFKKPNRYFFEGAFDVWKNPTQSEYSKFIKEGEKIDYYGVRGLVDKAGEGDVYVFSGMIYHEAGITYLLTHMKPKGQIIPITISFRGGKSIRLSSDNNNSYYPSMTEKKLDKNIDKYKQAIIDNPKMKHMNPVKTIDLIGRGA